MNVLRSWRGVRRMSSMGSVIEQLNKLNGEATVTEAFKAMYNHPHEVEVHQAGMKALARYDTDDNASESIAKGWKDESGNLVTGPEAMTRVLQENMDDTMIIDSTLKIMINMCWLTLTDNSEGSNQALLGMDGAVSLAAQVLHKHGRQNEKICARGLHALLMLTMYNKANAREAITSEAVNLSIAMLSTYPESLDIQDTGLALLLRLLNAPVDDNTQADYVYEKDPITTVNVLMKAAEHEVPQIHEKVWHGLALIAHNHKSLPSMARALVPPAMNKMVKQLEEAAASKSEENELRDQMLVNSASVVATLLEGDTHDASTTALTKGDFAKVAVIGLNKGVSEEVDSALSALLMTLSSHEDPILLDESTMATLVTRLRMNREKEATKCTLRTVWNLLNYTEGQQYFVTLGGVNIVKSLPLEDEEMSKLVEDIQLKVRNMIEA
eukprot:TRINITY_DN14334_c0_g1_i1.p1 TRINITY_DN14334_c0_g1~~TRINITY_DN14334_c0_g1_i1.p1  ORF type:complete len:440 (+),score=135.64 TRINITY_DN14334_c0_g1_i1:37-1356(+)